MSSSATGSGAQTSLPALVAQKVIDAEAAGLLWILRERGLPLVVSGLEGSGRRVLAAALDEASAASAPELARDEPMILGAESLAEVFDRLSAPPMSLMPDQLRGLGVVLIMRNVPDRGSRLFAAHYQRPVERDAGGHLQRRPPAVLAAWDESRDVHEHFAWAVATELAERVGLSMTAFENRHSQLTELLTELAAGGGQDGPALRSALTRNRPS